MKGLLVSTYRSNLSRGSSRLISNRYDKFIITGNDIPGIFDTSEDAPNLKITKFHGRKIALPMDARENPTGQYAFGGNFIYCSDSRFPSDTPIHIHDYPIGEECSRFQD